MAKTEQRARRLARLRAAGLIPPAIPRPQLERLCVFEKCDQPVTVGWHRYCESHQRRKPIGAES